MRRIESVNNKLVKRIASLKIKKYRDSEGLFIAEGERNVYDGAKKQVPEAVFVCDGYEGSKDYSCEVYSVSRPVFEKLSDTENPQGILGVFKKKAIASGDIKKGNVLIFDGIADPGNAGTLMRTALAFGFNNILTDKRSVDLFSPKVVRSAMSAVFSLNISITESLAETIPLLKEKGFKIYCADMGGEEIGQVEFGCPAAVIVGNEANGVGKEVLKLADKTVGIPMSGDMESLNAAVAGSILMYEVGRKKK